MFSLEEDDIPENGNSITSESDGRSDEWDPANEALGVQFSEIFSKSPENIHLLYDLIEVFLASFIYSFISLTLKTDCYLVIIKINTDFILVFRHMTSRCDSQVFAFSLFCSATAPHRVVPCSLPRSRHHLLLRALSSFWEKLVKLSVVR